MFEKITSKIPVVGKPIAKKTLQSDIDTLEREMNIAEYQAKNLRSQLEEKKEELRRLSEN